MVELIFQGITLDSMVINIQAVMFGIHIISHNIERKYIWSYNFSSPQITHFILT
jgi:hypothetical protein